MTNDDHGKPGHNRSEADPGEAFVRLLLEHEPHVRAFLRGLLPTRNDVDEVIQQASLVAWRKFGEFETGTAFGGWFLTIARFEALKHRRRLATSPLVFSEDIWELIANEGVSDSRKNLRELLDYCLAKLPADRKKLLLQVYSPGAVIREVAKQVGKNEEAFYKVIQRVRSVLLDCMRKELAKENA
jgi:RNA polymerase sigma-70 factor (ECF subfamily)